MRKVALALFVLAAGCGDSKKSPVPVPVPKPPPAPTSILNAPKGPEIKSDPNGKYTCIVCTLKTNEETCPKCKAALKTSAAPAPHAPSGVVGRLLPQGLDGLRAPTLRERPLRFPLLRKSSGAISRSAGSCLGDYGTQSFPSSAIQSGQRPAVGAMNIRTPHSSVASRSVLSSTEACSPVMAAIRRSSRNSALYFLRCRSISSLSLGLTSLRRSARSSRRVCISGSPLVSCDGEGIYACSLYSATTPPSGVSLMLSSL